jgi:hypothetical protein
VKVAVPAETRHPLENYPRRGQTSNVSEGGCYIEMVQTLDPATGIDVVLWLGDVKIEARAEVVSQHSNMGNGIRFMRMAGGDKSRLRQFLETARISGGLPFRKAGDDR